MWIEPFAYGKALETKIFRGVGLMWESGSLKARNYATGIREWVADALAGKCVTVSGVVLDGLEFGLVVRLLVGLFAGNETFLDQLHQR